MVKYTLLNYSMDMVIAREISLTVHQQLLLNFPPNFKVETSGAYQPFF